MNINKYNKRGTVFENYIPGYDYATASYDDLHEPPNTDEACKQYISRSVMAQKLYEEYRLDGLSCYQAMTNVLDVVTGQSIPA